jgi:hypothetical protein
MGGAAPLKKRHPGHLILVGGLLGTELVAGTSNLICISEIMSNA